jgi:hypothetical protein
VTLVDKPCRQGSRDHTFLNHEQYSIFETVVGHPKRDVTVGYADILSQSSSGLASISGLQEASNIVPKASKLNSATNFQDMYDVKPGDDAPQWLT